jgi:transposase
MDWLIGRQDSIEAKLAARYLADPQANLGRMALFDLTSTWLEGHKCELGEFGHSRDKKKGRRQVEFALITNPAGCPVALRVFPGNTSDPKACVEAVEALAGRFHIDDAILVGDRGSVTGTRIADLKEHGLGWIGALKHQQIAQLADDQDVFQPSLFDRQGILEIESERYPGERLIVCHNPDRAAWQQAKRERLVEATLALLGTVADRVDKGRLKTEASIGRATGRVIGKHGVARLITVETGPGWIAVGRNQTAITAEAALDGFYVIRTSVPASRLDPADTVRAYKNLSHVEQDFASIKGSDIEVRPIWHRRADRVQAHLLICLLAALIAWHLRQAWAPLTYGDEQPKDPGRHPVNPQTRSRPAARKASTQTTASGGPARSFRDLIDHLALMQRVTVAVTAGARPAHYTRITQPTDTQAEAFRLIGAAIPERLTPPR